MIDADRAVAKEKAAQEAKDKKENTDRIVTELSHMAMHHS